MTSVREEAQRWRNDALEAAVKIVEQCFSKDDESAEICATAIRALKQSTPPVERFVGVDDKVLIGRKALARLAVVISDAHMAVFDGRKNGAEDHLMDAMQIVANMNASRTPTHSVAAGAVRKSMPTKIDAPTTDHEAELEAVLREVKTALDSVVTVAKEAHAEWDAAPEGMKAGKLLIALSGKLMFYRVDIDAIHHARANVAGALSRINALTGGRG